MKPTRRWLVLPLLMLAGACAYLCWELLLDDGDDDEVFDPSSLELERSIDNGWPAEAVKHAYDTVDVLARREAKFHRHFRPAVATREFVTSLGIQPGDVVADIGCGTGALAMGLMEHGVPFKHLYEEDINAASLKFLRYLLKVTAYPASERVSVILGSETDPRLPAGAIDKVFIVNVPGLRSSGEEGAAASPIPEGVLKFFRAMVEAMRAGGELHVIFEGGLRETSEALIRTPLERSSAPVAYAQHAGPLQAVGLEILGYEERVVHGRIYQVVRARKQP